jgi:hypothetical protein
LNWFVEIVIWGSDGLVLEKRREERRRRLFEEARRIVARKRVDGYVRVLRTERSRRAIGGRPGLLPLRAAAWMAGPSANDGSVEAGASGKLPM